MLKSFDGHGAPVNSAESRCGPVAFTPEQSARMRALLSDTLDRLSGGGLPVQVAAPCEISSRGEGHFHLAPELFVQLAGSTEFRFPGEAITLAPGEALLLPPRLLHHEHVRTGAGGEPFLNLVIYAEGPALSCHLAHESEPGRPGILHLEACRHAQAPRIHDWLLDAARLGRAAVEEAPPARPALHDWAGAQARALVSAAAAGVLRALADADRDAPEEPVLIARLRVLVQNWLGDRSLSVRMLAEHSGCTPDYLSHVFSRTTGEHLAAYITRLRMERAARLLRESALAGKEIAWACGYATQSYFIRSFREHHGMTPKAWRAGHALAPAEA